MKTPINDGILQSDLDTNGFDILGLDGGSGLPDGGTAGQLLQKQSSTDGDADWATVSAGAGAGGSNQEFQYNQGGSLSGIPSLKYDGTIPLTISSTGMNTTTPGILAQNTTTTLPDGNSRSPSLIFKQHYYSGGDHVMEHKLEARDQCLVFQNRTDGGAWEPGFALSSNPAGGALVEYGGDIQIIAAVLRGLDDVTTGGDGGHPTRIGMFNYSTTARPGISMTSDAFIGWAIPSSPTYQSWEAQNDTLLDRPAAGVVRLQNVLQLKALTVATLPASPVVGQLANVSDGAAGLGTGAVIVGGGAASYLIWYNGTNWVVVGAPTAASVYIGTDARLVPVSGGVKLEARNTSTGTWVEAARWTNP